jgi:hypothetical protein
MFKIIIATKTDNGTSADVLQCSIYHGMNMASAKFMDCTLTLKDNMYRQLKLTNSFTLDIGIHTTLLNKIFMLGDGFVLGTRVIGKIDLLVFNNRKQRGHRLSKELIDTVANNSIGIMLSNGKYRVSYDFGEPKIVGEAERDQLIKNKINELIYTKVSVMEKEKSAALRFAAFEELYNKVIRATSRIGEAKIHIDTLKYLVSEDAGTMRRNSKSSTAILRTSEEIELLDEVARSFEDVEEMITLLKMLSYVDLKVAVKSAIDKDTAGSKNTASSKIELIE